jgi:hypothetical protein
MRCPQSCALQQLLSKSPHPCPWCMGARCDGSRGTTARLLNSPKPAW